jgi:hypothetical protein
MLLEAKATNTVLTPNEVFRGTHPCDLSAVRERMNPASRQKGRDHSRMIAQVRYLPVISHPSRD